MKYWEIIADRLSKSGWSLGWVSGLDSEGRILWIVDAHGYGKRFIVRVDEMLTAFVELQRAIKLVRVRSARPGGDGSKFRYLLPLNSALRISD